MSGWKEGRIDESSLMETDGRGLESVFRFMLH